MDRRHSAPVSGDPGIAQHIADASFGLFSSCQKNSRHPIFYRAFRLLGYVLLVPYLATRTPDAAGIVRQLHAISARHGNAVVAVPAEQLDCRNFGRYALRARNRTGFFPRDAFELRPVFAVGGFVDLRQGLLRRLVQSPGVAPGPSQNRLDGRRAGRPNPTISITNAGDHH